MSETATLPSPAAATAPRAVARTNRRGRWVDVALVGLAVAFAFLSGSFVARNSDLWMHLAAGRLIVNAQYSFGVDPFSYTTAGRYWANNAWLSDAGMYLVYRSLGASALVVIKAVIVALIAGVMFWVARGRGPVWLRTSCILLAILAMTPRLLLQPSVISLLLLALCLGCLHAGGRLLRAVPILIVLWVNLDSWFILGPLLVVLFWIGRRIDPDRTALDPWPVWLVPAALFACLVSPHHVFGLTLPLELSPAVWTGGFATDPRYSNVFLSPWHWSLYGAAGGYNLASWSFVILLGLGLLSFAIKRDAFRTGRGLVWVAFAALACWQARLIPFFAVVAGPITALNLGERVPDRTFRRPARAILVLASLALVALGWLGWTVGFRNHERGAGWAIHTDATLARAATGIAEWRAKNGIPSDRHVFTTHVDLGHYLAWFAPGEKSAIDSRLQLFGYGDYVSLSRVLGLLPADEYPPDAFKQVLSQNQIAAVALYDPDPRRLGAAISTVLYKAKPPGTIARVDGSCVLIVPDNMTSAASFDPERMAFGRSGAEDVPAAGNGPAGLAEPTPPWVIKRSHGRGGSWEADSAAVYLGLFEERSHRDTEQFPPVPSYPLWFVGETLRRAHSTSRSPALPLLAIRAARRGAEIDSRDASAWSVLGRAYLVLGERTWEADAGEGLTLLRYVRVLQATTALVQAALLSPDSPGIRQSLAGLYWSQGAFDLAHRHAADALRITRRNGPASGETREMFDQRLARDAEFVNRLDAIVMENENRFIIMTAGLSGDPLARARIARQLGLHQKAIDTLVKSHPDLYGTEGIKLLIELLIATGQAAEARVLLDRDEIRRAPDGLAIFSYPGKSDGTRWAYQFPAYPWLNFCQYAASGQYDRAEASLEVISELLARNEAALAPRYATALSRQAVAEAAIAVPTCSLFDRLIIAQVVEVQREHLVQVRMLSAWRADLGALAGILELERGRAAEGEQRLLAAKALFADVRPFASSLPGLAIVSRYLDALREKR